jgi:AraC-like DNA-binding protein
MQPGTGVLQSVVRGALAPYISSFHYIGGSPPAAGGLECILPGARVHLMVNLYEDEFRTYQGLDVHRTRGAVLGGPHAASTVIDTREQCGLLTVDFKLAGAARFFAAPLSEAQDHLVELDQLWGRDGAVLREQLLEAPTAEAKFQVLESVLLRHLVDAHDPDPAIPFAAHALGRGVPVSEVTERVGLLPKTFARRFSSQVGLTPKRYSRVRRLQRLVSSIRIPAEADWSELAAEHGYADQAHLVHDFRDLTGMTPAAYRPRSYEERNHVPV